MTTKKKRAQTTRCAACGRKLDGECAVMMSRRRLVGQLLYTGRPYSYDEIYRTFRLPLDEFRYLSVERGAGEKQIRLFEYPAICGEACAEKVEADRSYEGRWDHRVLVPLPVP